jgi:hypothetical protein
MDNGVKPSKWTTAQRKPCSNIPLVRLIAFCLPRG